MALAKEGDKVTINFIGRLEDGTVIDTTYESDHHHDQDCGCDDEGCGCEPGPMELVIGEEEFFPQVEQALIGMAPGDKKTVKIPAEDAFGEYDQEKVFSIGRDQVPADIKPEVGQELEFTGDDDEVLEVTVVDVTDEGILLDANHPLAGEDLTYEIELVAIL
jgi:peptidylprolyl isomerase